VGLKRLLVAAVAGLLLQASVSTAHALSGSDWLWLGPLVALGAAAAVVLTVGIAEDSKDDDRPSGRPRRGRLAPSLDVAGHGGEESRLTFDPRHCAGRHGPALFCW